MTFGKKLKERRETLGLTQDYVANAIGINPGCYSRWEKNENKPRYKDMISRLANVLGVSEEYFSDCKDDAPIDIYKIIDEAMEKKDRSLTILITPTGTSVSVYPYSEGTFVGKRRTQMMSINFFNEIRKGCAYLKQEKRLDGKKTCLLNDEDCCEGNCVYVPYIKETPDKEEPTDDQT